MVEHQDASAEPVRAHLEARAVARKRIWPGIPCVLRLNPRCRQDTSVRVGGHRLVTPLAVVADGAEHPLLVIGVRRVEMAGPETWRAGVEQLRCAVAPADAAQVAV